MKKEISIYLVFIAYSFTDTSIYATEGCQNQPADIGFLIDESGSVGFENFRKNLDFVNKFVDAFDISDNAVKISVFAFHHFMGEGFYFSCCSDKSTIKAKVNAITYNSGSQDFEMALDFARKSMFNGSNGARPQALKILLFFTDGRSFVENGGLELHRIGVIVYAVGVGGGVLQEQLDKIATNKSYVFMVDNYSSLVGNVYNDIKSKTCSDVLSNPCERSPQPCMNQGTCLHQGGSKYICLCPEGFTGHNCQTDINYCEGVICHNGGTCVDGLTDFTCDCPEHFTGTYCERDMCRPYPSDVIFVIDSSESFSSKYFTIAKNYIFSLTHQWDISPNYFQLAVVSFADSPLIELDFDNTLDKVTLESALSNMTFRGGISEIHKGLELAVYKLQARDRKVGSAAARKFIILLSDGLPSSPRHVFTPTGNGIDTLTVAIGEDVSHHFLLKVADATDKIFPYNSDRLWNYMMNTLIYHGCGLCQTSEDNDILFLVDTSSGVDIDLRVTVPAIIEKIMDEVTVDPFKSQIALITYNSAAEQRFDFNTYKYESSRPYFERQLSSFIQSEERDGNLTLMLNATKTLIFDHGAGARQKAQKKVIVISGFQNILTPEEKNVVKELAAQNVDIFVIGFDMNDQQFETMSELASTSFHIGIHGTIEENSIDTFISIFKEQLKFVKCALT